MARVQIAAEPMMIIDLYNKVAVAAGVDPDKVKNYDCTKIRVAENLQDAVVEKYKQECRDYKLAFGMDWVCFGPKVDKDLEDGVVEYEDEFMKMEVE